MLKKVENTPVRGHLPRTVRLEVPFSTLFRILLVAAGIWLTIELFGVVMVLVAALFLVGTLNPIVEWMQARGVRRGHGVAMIFTLGLAAIVVVVALTLPPLATQVFKLVRMEPVLRDKLADLLSQWEVSAALSHSLRNFHYDTAAAASTFMGYSMNCVAIAAYVGSTVFLALYLLLDRDRLRGGLFSVVPRNYHLRLTRVLLKLETIVGGYIRGQFVTSVLMGVVVFSLLTACGIENAIAFAVFAGITDVLPYIGGVLAVVPASAAGLEDGIGTALLILGVLVAYQEFESRIIIPRVYGNTLKLPSSIILIALLTGGTLYGVLGALISLPIAAALRMLIEELRVELPGQSLTDREVQARDETAEREYVRRTEGLPAVEAARIALQISEQRQREEGMPKPVSDLVPAGGE